MFTGKEVGDQSGGDRTHSSEFFEKNELSFVDLVVIVINRRITVAVTTILCVAAGFVFLSASPKQTRYSIAIKVGSTPTLVGSNAHDQKLLEEPASLVNKLEKITIPLVMQEFVDNGGPRPIISRTDASVVPGSDIIILEMRGPIESSEAIIKILDAVVKKVKEEHQRLVEIKRSSLILELKESELELARAENTPVGLEGVRELDIELIKTILGEMSRNVSQGGSEPKFSNESRQRLLNDLLLSFRNLELESRKIQIDEVNRKVRSLKVLLDGFFVTDSLGPTIKSVVGQSRAIVLGGSLVAGLALGICLAFFAELLAAARQRMQASRD